MYLNGKKKYLKKSLLKLLQEIDFPTQNRRNIKLVNKAYLPDIDRVLKVSLNNR